MTIGAGAPEVTTTRSPRLRQLPGLDGLRAVAVVAVILFHLNPHWLPGGFLGVDIFFVISGYLITSLVVSEFRRTSAVSLPKFWKRRARRLLPALVALLLVVTVLASVFARDSLKSMRGDVPAALVYVLNWRLVLTHDSYVASFGRPPLLQHLWSLAVEEQFYLLWPPVLLLMLRRQFSRNHIALWAVAGAAVSALLMAFLYHPGGNPSAVYFGTATHADGLLIGCAVAAAVPQWRMTADVTPTARKVIEWGGVLALAVVFACLVTLHFDATATYRGGMVVLDLATVAVVASVAHPASRLGAGLGRQPLSWLGLRSYSLYLWHWPIFAMTRPGRDLAWSTWPDVGLRLGLTAAAAELSYRYIEQPWRTGRAQAAWRARIAPLPRPQMAAVVALPVALVALLLSTAPGPAEPAILSEGSTAAARTLLPAPPPSGVSMASQIPLPTDGSAPGGPVPSREDVTADTRHPLVPRPPTTASVPATSVTTAPTTLPPPPPVPAADEPILAIGDSVLLAASPNLSVTFGPAVTVDAQVGRQVAAGISRLTQYRTSGDLSRYKTVVIDLGTNGTFTAAQFDQIAGLLAGVAHVVFFDVHADRSWIPGCNATIVQGVAAHPGQMTLADWNGAVNANLLYADGIHPTAGGAARYTQLLETALAPPPAARP